MSSAVQAEAADKVSASSEGIRDDYDFFELPRPIQDRLLASLSGTGAPRILLFNPASSVIGLGAIALFVASASVVTGLAVTGYGSLTSSLAIQAPLFTSVYGVFGGLAAVALAAYAWANGAQGRYPYRFGTYLFPVGVVVISGPSLSVYRLEKLSAVEVPGAGKIRLRFGDTAFTFVLPTSVSVDQMKKSLDEYRRRWEVAFEAKDRRALATLDPIRDSGFSNPLSSNKSMSRPRDQRIWRYGLALLVGAGIGVLVFMARNKLGERALFQQATSLDGITAYENYLARGGSRGEVTDILLPRARLKEIIGDTTRLEQFRNENPDSKIRQEIDLAYREALLADLQKVRQNGTLAALAQFEKSHADHEIIKNELRVARREVFDKAYAGFLERFSVEPDIAKLFRAMVTFAEQNGPQVEVRFRRKEPVSAKSADNAIRRSAYYAGTASLPSQYFEGEYAAAREKETGEALVEGLQAAFPAEVLAFAQGESTPAEEDKIPEVDKPTLFLTYKTEMSGGYTTNRPRNVYVGVGFMIQAEFVVPKVEDTYTFKFSKWLPPDINEISRESMKPVQVYEKNVRLGFEQFTQRLLADLLPPRKEG